MTRFLPRFLWTFLALAALVVVGSVGYVLIEHQPLADSLYMTAITITAVGYQEVFELSPRGRTFTMFVLMGGISWMGLWFATITSFIVELDLKDALRRRRNMQEISQMKDHVIICGAGRTGRQVAQEIETMTQDYVIIERDAAQIVELDEYLPKAHVIEGDATHDHVLLEAGLMEAKGLITCLSADTDNLFVCLSARDLAAKLKIVARAYEEETISKLYRAGADQVVSPNVSSAIRMASILLRPSAVSFLDIATRSANVALRAEEAKIAEGSAVAGKSLREARIPEETGLIVIAVKNGEGASGLTFNPSASTLLRAGDELIVLGGEEQIGKLRAYVS
jgi:voltage-gated potassium channel